MGKFHNLNWEKKYMVCIYLNIKYQYEMDAIKSFLCVCVYNQFIERGLLK